MPPKVSYCGASIIALNVSGGGTWLLQDLINNIKGLTNYNPYNIVDGGPNMMRSREGVSCYHVVLGYLGACCIKGFEEGYEDGCGRQEAVRPHLIAPWQCNYELCNRLLGAVTPQGAGRLGGRPDFHSGKLAQPVMPQLERVRGNQLSVTGRSMSAGLFFFAKAPRMKSGDSPLSEASRLPGRLRKGQVCTSNSPSYSKCTCGPSA
jgi:hypothetical protein